MAEKKRVYHRLEDLEVAAVALVDRPAVDIEFLVLKMYTPPEEGPMTTTKNKKPGDGEPGEAPPVETETGGEPGAPEAPLLPPPILRSLKSISTALSELLPEEVPGCDICAAARSLQAAVEKAYMPEAAEKDEPLDFQSAWQSQVMADTLWKAFMTLESVVVNIARSDKTPEEKLTLFDSVLTDFGGVARQVLGVTKSEPATEGAPPPEEPTDKSADPAPTADPAQAGDGVQVVELLNELVGWVKDLDARVSKAEEEPSKPPEAPAGDGAVGAAADADKPVTFGQALKLVRDEIAKARNPIYKAKLPEEPATEAEPGAAPAQPYNVFDRGERRKRVTAATIALLKGHGIPVIDE